MSQKLPMLLDMMTVGVVDLSVSLCLGLVALASWTRHRQVRALAWWASAYLSMALAILLLALGSVKLMPGVLGIGWLALIVGFSSLWSGAREFGGRRSRFELIGLLCIVWGLFWTFLLPLIPDPLNAFLQIAHLLLGVFSFAAAYAFWRDRDEHLASRWAAIGLLATLGLTQVLHVPLIFAVPLAVESNVYASPWYGILALVRALLQVGIAFSMLGMVRERLEQEHKAVACTDSLTGLSNRRAFLDAARGRLRRHCKDGRPAAVLMFDLDHFKRVNDRFGHAVGDRILCAFARAACAQLRTEDVIGRIGGEEFAAFLADTDRDEAVAAANRVRVAFANAAEDVGGVLVGTTVSAGVALATGEEDLESMLARADAALYAAKSRGRNRVEVAAPMRARVTQLDPARRKGVPSNGVPAVGSPNLVPGEAVKQPVGLGK